LLTSPGASAFAFPPAAGATGSFRARRMAIGFIGII